MGTEKGTKKIFCGIDPGREKFGFAICREGEGEGALLFSAIAPIDAACVATRAVASGDLSGLSPWRTEGTVPRPDLRVDAVFLGDGTGHDAFARALAECGVAYALADEAMTTLAARAIYWRLHPPRFPLSLLPLSLRVPPRPIDDLAAWAIAKKGLERTGDRS